MTYDSRKDAETAIERLNGVARYHMILKVEWTRFAKVLSPNFTHILGQTTKFLICTVEVEEKSSLFSFPCSFAVVLQYWVRKNIVVYLFSLPS